MFVQFVRYLHPCFYSETSLKPNFSQIIYTNFFIHVRLISRQDCSYFDITMSEFQANFFLLHDPASTSTTPMFSSGIWLFLHMFLLWKCVYSMFQTLTIVDHLIYNVKARICSATSCGAWSCGFRVGQWVDGFRVGQWAYGFRVGEWHIWWGAVANVSSLKYEDKWYYIHIIFLIIFSFIL